MGSGLERVEAKMLGVPPGVCFLEAPNRLPRRRLGVAEAGEGAGGSRGPLRGVPKARRGGPGVAGESRPASSGAGAALRLCPCAVGDNSNGSLGLLPEDRGRCPPLRRLFGRRTLLLGLSGGS